MIDSPALLADLKRELKSLENDLRVRAEDDTTAWGARLRDEHRRAQARERTGLPWIQWRDGEVSQAAVAWIIATVFIRFCEDNGQLVGAELDGVRVSLPWIAAPGDGLERAVENEAAYYAAEPTRTGRDWLQHAFRTLGALPAGRPLVDPDHSAVWRAPISATAADALLAFFRRTTVDGVLVHDFSDSELSTRFLGDLYQDLSDYAKKTYALLQTPDFVEEFILDLTLTPAIEEFGLTGLKLIDPACGSGHFLLGAFERLVKKWSEFAPGVERGERVQRALDSIHGVDLNPFAIAIARFRLTVAAIKAAGYATLVHAPAFRYRLAIGDSLLGGVSPNQGLDLGDDDYFEYETEDLREYAGILEAGQYHVVVANPPYIQAPDPRLRDRYRDLYSTCHRKYQLSVPFMELLFRLALRPGASGGGRVGQITSNAFMKREFGKKLIEQFLSGDYFLTPQHDEVRVDLTHVIDTSGVPLPGHGTPTIILIGRRGKPQLSSVRAVLGIRGEAATPAVPAKGRVWREIVDHIADESYDGTYVSIASVPRAEFATHPWSVAGGGAGALKERIEEASVLRVRSAVMRLGFFGVIGLDDAFMVPPHVATTLGEPAAFRDLVVGDGVRDFQFRDSVPAFFPYNERHELLPLESFPANRKRMWPLRTVLGNRPTFGRRTYFAEGRPWYEWHQLPPDADAHAFTISYAFQETHNHFVLDRDGRAFGRTAPIIKLRAEATEEDHLGLLGALNSSTVCFWLKQVSFPRRLEGEAWETYFEYSGTKIEDCPLPAVLPSRLFRDLDAYARKMGPVSPRAAVREPLHEVERSRTLWDDARRMTVAIQEELDWRVYVAFGLADQDLAPDIDEYVPIDPNERGFEIQLARSIAAGEVESVWFERHGRTPIEELPEHWPDWYRDLVERRLAATKSNESLALLEQPEFKRRWAGASWDHLLAGAVQVALLDRLCDVELWFDASGRPLARSVAQLADELRHDELVRGLLVLHTRSQDYDLATEVGTLLKNDAVPGFATLRYKESGLEKFRAWLHTWEVQRSQDDGVPAEAPVPPEYSPSDFVKQSFRSARGKLDVPKERFTSFPGSKFPDDQTEVYGWAGWDHAERGQAVARFANDLVRAGSPDEQIIPLVGVLLEIEPWLKQWHDQIDPRAGVSPASAVAAVTTSLLDRLGLGRDQIISWRPPAPARGRKKAS